jgi:PGF-pre-PGF domain-containing protein
MHPFIKNVRTSSIRVIVTISLYIALVLCAVGLIGVGTAPASGVNLSVDFNSNVTSGPAPLIVEFTGISDNATKWEWDLGDGNVSDVKDPSHTYFAPGVYNVTPTVSGMNETVTESKENYILVYQPVMPEADFSAAPSSGYAPLNVAFTDLSSNASSWDWDFGDGNTSTEQHPVHTYNSAGTYTVTLTVVENGTTESKTNLITVLQVLTYSVSPEVIGGAANITIDRPLAEEGQTVNVTISAIQTGKQFASISVTGESNQVNATEVIPGVSYTFTMPAENVNVTVTLEDIPVTTYDIQTEVTGGSATVTTDPAGAAEKGTNVTVTISDIESGKQFKSITVKSGPGKRIETSVQSPGNVYTFTMPEKAVTVTVELEDSPVSAVTVTGIEVSKPPAKESYIEGETLNLTDLVVRLTKSNDSTVDVAFKDFAANGLVTNPANGSTLSIANKTVTITHTDGATATQKINVSAVTITDISIEKAPTKVNYTAGETLDLSGLVVRLTKSNGSTADVELAGFAANGLTTNPANGSTLSIANKTVTITHTDGATVTQSITVNAAPVQVTSITLTGSGNSTKVEKGKTLQMIAAVLPENASNKNVVWYVVSGSGTASISTGGLLTGTGEGTVTVKATAADGSGVQDTIEITVTATTASSGGGGGGGSQNTGEKNENIELKDYSIKYVLKDTETLFEFTKEGNSILSLGYTASLNGGQTKTIIEMLKGTSTLVSKAAPGIVYKNMNIWVGDGKAPAMLSDARIVFRVEKTWLSENRIDPASIRMFRYSGGSWNQLPTSMTGEDDTYVYYLARTPGFSAFAISGINEAQQAASTGAQQELSLSNEESAQMSTADSKTSEISDAVSQEAQSAGSFTLLLVIAAITALGVLSYRHRDYLSQVRMQLGNPDGKRYRRIRK